MSTLARRLARALRAARHDPGDAVSRADLERQEALVRDAVADLSERLAAMERRLAALEARDR